MAPQGSERGAIVVVDDDNFHAHALRAILESQGFASVEVENDPRVGLSRVISRHCDLLILDLHMPGLNGIEFLMELSKSVPREEMFPVLILTGDDDPGLRDTALALGSMDYLTKPFRRSEVLLRVRNLLRSHFLHLEVRSHAATLEGQVRERTMALNDAYLDTVRRLALAAEYRDDATGRHIQRVGSRCESIALRLGLNGGFPELLYHAAQLHDIGKIGIPDAILLKPGKLTNDEFDSMKRHAEMGARILQESPSPLMRLASEVALTHHERWDGRGYPNGKAGKDIPISGRITSVADVFDALTHARPYKEAWPVHLALEELRAQSGKQFDPEVVEAFLRLEDLESDPE